MQRTEDSRRRIPKLSMYEVDVEKAADFGIFYGERFCYQKA